MNLRTDHIIKTCRENGYDITEEPNDIMISSKQTRDFVMFSKFYNQGIPRLSTTKKFESKILGLL